MYSLPMKDSPVENSQPYIHYASCKVVRTYQHGHLMRTYKVVCPQYPLTYAETDIAKVANVMSLDMVCDILKRKKTTWFLWWSFKGTGVRPFSKISPCKMHHIPVCQHFTTFLTWKYPLFWLITNFIVPPNGIVYYNTPHRSVFEKKA